MKKKNEVAKVENTNTTEKKKFDWKGFGVALGTTCLTAFATGIFMFAGQKTLETTYNKFNKK